MKGYVLFCELILCTALNTVFRALLTGVILKGNFVENLGLMLVYEYLVFCLCSNWFCILQRF